MKRILIVEDEQSIRNVLVNILTEESKDFDVTEAIDGAQALSLIEEVDFDLVICDIKMPKIDGIETLERALKNKPDLPFVMISGHGTIDTAVQAIKMGAYDYISKPPDLNRLLHTVRNALDKKLLLEENRRLKYKIDQKYNMIGHSKAIERIKNIIEKVAPTEARILITGPNGTGKELVAHWIHNKSHRNEQPLIEVNCAAIPSELIESELFGHEKGSFTGALKQKKGKFEQAQGGTLFLDEVGDMSLSAQAKVLRALQENKISRVGGDKDIAVDIRIMAATNKDLKKEIDAGRFREDLYHRLAVILIEVPSLNERLEDIPMLAQYFIEKISHEQAMCPKPISDEALKALENIRWDGNIREFQNVIERLMILSGKEITEKDIKQYASK